MYDFNTECSATETARTKAGEHAGTDDLPVNTGSGRWLVKAAP